LTSILVAGGTGFVGRHLVQRLRRDHEVAVMSRTRADTVDGVRTVVADASDPSSLEHAFDGIEVAYYLIHSLGRDDFAEVDHGAAEHFGRAAAAAGVRRIVYLGGLGGADEDLSPHLRSRREVEQILSRHVDTVALRAAIVVGQGSLSWELLCQLVERLPVMVTPRWVDTVTQPIALVDVVEYLALAADPAVPAGHYDVGAPEATTYRAMMRTVADLLRRPLLIIPVPLLTPRLSSRWIRFVTDVDTTVAGALVESLGNPVEVTERRLEALTGHRPMAFLDAATSALATRLDDAADAIAA
jgi:uncharacterized protein YbjT (DUF2867 family)